MVLKLIRISLIPLALLSVLALRLLKGRIRIGRLWTDRIGHLAGNVDVHLCERKAGIRHKCLEIWTAGAPCNNQLLKMWKRVLHVDRTGFAEIVQKVNKLFQGWENIEIPTGNLDRDVNNLLEKYPPHMSFTSKEEAKGEAELWRMGIPDGAKWVCLMVRDSAYLPELAYHSYRDSDIDSYMDAAESLAERGYYVIRMGAKVNKPFNVSHPNVIDYATNGRSDFMDIYLAAKCAFAISTSTGLDAVCSAFRRPICYVNFVPLEYLPTWATSLAIWKHHYKSTPGVCTPECADKHIPGYEVLHLGSRDRMTPAEIYESGSGQFMRAEEFEQAGITLVDNTPEEIKSVVEEMADTIEGRIANNRYWNRNRSQSQDEFWNAFPRSISPFTGQELHGEIRLRIGSEFLKGYINHSEPVTDNLMCYYG